MQDPTHGRSVQEDDELLAEIEAIGSGAFTKPVNASATTQVIALLPASDTLSEQATAPRQKTQLIRIHKLLRTKPPTPETEAEPDPLPPPPTETLAHLPPPVTDVGELATVPYKIVPSQDIDPLDFMYDDTLPPPAHPQLIPPRQSRDSISDQQTVQVSVCPSAITAPDDVRSAKTQPPSAATLEPSITELSVAVAPALPRVSTRKLIAFVALSAATFIGGAMFGALLTLGKARNNCDPALPQPTTTECSASQQLAPATLQPPLPCPAPVMPNNGRIAKIASVTTVKKPLSPGRTSTGRLRATPAAKKLAAPPVTPAISPTPPPQISMIMGDYIVNSGPDELRGVATYCGLSSADTILNMMPNSKIIEDAKAAGKRVLPSGTVIRVPCTASGLEPLVKSGRFKPLFKYPTTSSL